MSEATTINYQKASDGTITETVRRTDGSFYTFLRRRNPSGIGFAISQTTQLTKEQGQQLERARQ